MIVPEAEKLHWRSVSISIQVPRGHLDLESLARAWGSLTTGFVVETSDVLVGQTYASVYPLEEEWDFDEHTVQVDSYRGDDADQELFQRLDESGFYSILHSCIHDVDELQVVSVTDLYYPATQAAWRMKMLADTPSLEEFRSEIGTISLSGVKLRFSNSPHGLLESFLEVSPDEGEYRCSLTVFNRITPDELTSLHRTVLSQAEEFAQLFVELKE